MGYWKIDINGQARHTMEKERLKAFNDRLVDVVTLMVIEMNVPPASQALQA